MKVLMPTYGGGHVNVVIPVAKELLKRGNQAVILGFTAAIPFLQKSGLVFKTLADYMFLFEKEQDEILALGNKLAEKYHNAESGIDYQQTVLYYGLSMCFLIKEKGEEKAWQLFEEKQRTAFLPVEVMDSIIKFEQPDIVTASCDVRMELAGAIAARENKIPSIFICDVDFVAEKCMDFSYITTPNMIIKEKYIKAGYNKNSIIVTGQPAFDHLFEIVAEEARRQVEQDLTSCVDKILITWASGRVAGAKEIFEGLVDLAKNRKDWCIVVKLHPASQEMKDFTLDIEDKLPNNLFVIKHYPVQTLLAASDVVIVQESTCGQEAIILDKPVIVINNRNLIYPIRYDISGAALLVENLSDLEAGIEKALYDDEIKKQQMEGRYAYKVEKNGAKNVVDAIHNIVGRNCK